MNAYKVYKKIDRQLTLLLNFMSFGSAYKNFVCLTNLQNMTTPQNENKHQIQMYVNKTAIYVLYNDHVFDT